MCYFEFFKEIFESALGYKLLDIFLNLGCVKTRSKQSLSKRYFNILLHQAVPQNIEGFYCVFTCGTQVLKHNMKTRPSSK